MSTRSSGARPGLDRFDRHAAGEPREAGGATRDTSPPSPAAAAVEDLVEPSHNAARAPFNTTNTVGHGAAGVRVEIAATSRERCVLRHGCRGRPCHRR